MELFEHFHDLIDEKYHKLMCLKPALALDAWIRVKHYFLIGTKIWREFQKYGIVRSAEVVDFDLDTKLYTLKWEEKKKDTENDNIYTAQKTELYLYLDELKKLCVG